MQRHGHTPLTPTQALTHYTTTHQHPTPHTIPINLTPPPNHPTHTPPLYRTITPHPTTPPTNHPTNPHPHTTQPTNPTPLLTQLTHQTPQQRHHTLLTHIQTHTATILGHPNPTTIHPHQPFNQQGLDSLTTIELRNQLQKTTGLHLPPTTIFDHPTPTHLAQHLNNTLQQTAKETLKDEALASFDELDRLFSEFTPDDGSRPVLISRMTELLAKWKNTDTSSQPEEDSDLSSATDEELFEIFDKRFDVD
ncbi:hypothetical protein AVL59_15420 [Streptomyces griseochromogenes]|uniref:Carrier domain-containing protein n=2 Tax=Streptomyces griseochromogenes TaxID=68214 RepID=A0A1B1AWB3_9ACTN|nr:hypothetical protein AVL59_15420 [Streptomyces griseochromogenes]